MKRNKKEVSKKAGVRLGLVVGLVIAMLFISFTFPKPILEQDKDTRSWHIVWEGNLAQAAEATPGAGAGGILEVFFTNHTATASTTYLENTSSTIEGWCTANMPGKTPYANADNLGTELDHTTTFDVVVRVRGNATHCKRAAVWYTGDLRVRWTCAGLSIGADTVMYGNASRNDTNQEFLWINFYSAGGSGFSLVKDQSIEITSIKFEAYY